MRQTVNFVKQGHGSDYDVFRVQGCITHSSPGLGIQKSLHEIYSAAAAMIKRQRGFQNVTLHLGQHVLLNYSVECRNRRTLNSFLRKIAAAKKEAAALTPMSA